MTLIFLNYNKINCFLQIYLVKNTSITNIYITITYRLINV